MDKVVPDHWKRVECSMSGVWIERNVENLSGWKVLRDRLDVIHVPDWDLHYEVNAGEFSTDAQIQTALNMFSFGRSRGIATGKELARDEIRKALGLPDSASEEYK